MVSLAGQERSALSGIATAGRFGRVELSGLTIVERTDIAFASVIARRDQRGTLATACNTAFGLMPPDGPRRVTVGALTFAGTGPGQWIASSQTEPNLAGRLRAVVGPFAAVTDQSDSRLVLQLSGANVRDVLAKGVPLDLHPNVFKVGDVAVTLVAYMGVQIDRLDETNWQITTPRSTAGSFWSWLSASAAEFGYDVVTGATISGRVRVGASARWPVPGRTAWRSSAPRAMPIASAGARSHSPSAPSRARSIRSIRRAANFRVCPRSRRLATCPARSIRRSSRCRPRPALQAADECIAKGVKAAVMFSSGFAETGAEGRAMQVEPARAARAGGMKLVGPNSLGMFNARSGIYSTFSSYFNPLWPRVGPVSIVSQSGAVGTYFLAIGAERGLGFIHFDATGNEADDDVAECVERLADDPDTGVIMIYLEGCRDGARLRAALARAAANRKPVVAMKVGVSEQGIAAIASHTGSLAGSDAVFDAVFAENNVHRAQSLDELVDVAYACSGGVYPKSPRLGVVTLSGGVGIQMADAAVEMGLELPRMPDAAQQKILALVPFAGPANPVDTTAQVVNDWPMFTTILGITADDGGVDSVVSFLAHMGTTPGLMDRLKPAFLDVRQRFPDRVFILCARLPRDMADELTAMGFLIFEDPTRAIMAVAALSRLAQGYAAPATRAAEVAARTATCRGADQ